MIEHIDVGTILFFGALFYLGTFITIAGVWIIKEIRQMKIALFNQQEKYEKQITEKI